MTAYGSIETAVEAMQEGAADYLTKPFSFKELDLRLIKIAGLRTVRNELARPKEALHDDEARYGLIVRSPAMQRVWERIELFADQPAPVLVTGETGTGKELVSRAIHQLSSRREGAFVPVASGAIPYDLARPTAGGGHWPALRLAAGIGPPYGWRRAMAHPTVRSGRKRACHAWEASTR